LTVTEREKYTAILREKLGDYRYQHCLNVAKEAMRLAKIHGADPKKAELAGLLHDVMKEADEETQLRYLRRKNKRPTPLLLSLPKLWHAPAGAAFVELELKIHDRDVINAVRYHTTAREGMSLLEKIVYVADFTSEDRTYSDVEEIRAAADRDLREAMIIALSHTICKFGKRNSVIHPDTFRAYNEVLLSGGNK